MKKKAIVCFILCLFFLSSFHLFSQDNQENTSTEETNQDNNATQASQESLDPIQSETDDLPQEVLSEEVESSIITIKNALKTSYLRDEDDETERIIFEGDVQVSVERDNTTTTIFADYIEFDRARNSLYAQGTVIMEQEQDGEITERLTANSLLFDTNTLQGYFNEGRVVQEQQEALNLSDDSVLIVSSELFARGSSNTVTFKNGSLTFCNAENPHWEIKASRIWLLDGNEFAFANALLYVGPVPVMYFPFFYYPKDELVFNPAFGFRSREGFFIQTSTYLIGRKPLASDTTELDNDTGFNFLQQTQLKEQELQGLILRNLEDNAIMPPNHLKVMADYYTTLGGMVGVEGFFEVNDVVQFIEFDTRLGFSNVVFQIDEFPLYISYNNNQKYNDYGWFLGTKLPFRYAANLETKIQAGSFRLAVEFPFYSDPWFDSDFADRSESMDWIDFFLSGALVAPPQEDDDDDTNEITGFTWNVIASYTVPSEYLSPWISTLSLDSLSSSASFSTQDAPVSEFNGDLNLQANSPNREFFYPSKIQPFNFAISMNGTLFEWNSSGTESNTSTTIETTDAQKEIISELEIPEEFPELIEKTEIAEEKSTDEKDASENSLALDDLPEINSENLSIASIGESEYTVQYSIKPEYAMLYTYSPIQAGSSLPIAPSDINILDPQLAQIYFKSPVTFTGTYDTASQFLSVTNTLSFLPEIQKHIFISDAYYSEAQKEDLLLSDHRTQKLDLTNTNKISIKPLSTYSMFENSSVSWNTSINIIRTEFDGTATEPAWNYNSPSWDDDTIDEHNLNAVLEAKQGDYNQSLSLATNLPPLVDQYLATLKFGFPIGTLQFNGGYKQESITSSAWLALPLKQSSSWVFFSETSDGESNPNKIQLNQSFEYNIEDKYADSLITSLSWRSLQFSYNMQYSNSYTLDPTVGWISSADKVFQPYSLALALNINNLTIRNESSNIIIKPGLSSSISWDMIIPTRSYFSFRPSLSLEISRFLTITFSSESRNDQLVRYLQNVIGFSPEIPGEQNIFIDLFNSFAFLDETKRTSSGFKIERFSLELEHDLHDWTLSTEFEIEPRIITETDGSKRFDYSPFFTLSILWKPMSGIKTTIEDEHGTFTLNP